MDFNSQDDHNPFAAPQSDLTPETFGEVSGPFVYAGFWSRFVAEVIDIVIINFVEAVVEIGLRIVAIAGASYVTTIDLLLLAKICELVFKISFSLLYYPLQECSRANATIGKRLMGLRVLDLAGQRISFGRATGRYFGKLISVVLLFVGYLMQPFTSRRQTLHDIMAGTIVVKG